IAGHAMLALPAALVHLAPALGVVVAEPAADLVSGAFDEAAVVRTAAVVMATWTAPLLTSVTAAIIFAPLPSIVAVAIVAEAHLDLLLLAAAATGAADPRWRALEAETGAWRWSFRGRSRSVPLLGRIAIQVKESREKARLRCAARLANEAPRRPPRARRRRRGAVAQMGERCNRTAEVRGSIPLSSTSPSRCRIRSRN